MLRLPVVVGTFLFTTVALATPPGSGQHFDCSDGGTSSCATDDTGCVPDSKDHLKCSDSLSKAFATAIKAHSPGRPVSRPVDRSAERAPPLRRLRSRGARR